MTDRCRNQELQMAQAQQSAAEYAVSDQLVLAGQPAPKDWQILAHRGFKTVVNIRQDAVRAAEQAKKAKEAGLHYIHLPLPAYELESEHLEQFNQIISNAAHGKTFFHCRSASRTGLIWMLKRTAMDGWTEEQAEAELRAAGYDDDNIDTFQFCAEDYFERTISPELHLEIPVPV